MAVIAGQTKPGRDKGCEEVRSVIEMLSHLQSYSSDGILLDWRPNPTL